MVYLPTNRMPGLLRVQVQEATFGWLHNIVYFSFLRQESSDKATHPAKLSTRTPPHPHEPDSVREFTTSTH